MSFGRIAPDRLLHPKNAHFLMMATDLGIWMNFSAEQSANAPSSISDTELGIWIPDNDEHPKNDHSNIVFTESGICTFVNAEHRWNVPLAISGILGRQTLVSAEHPLNAYLPIVVTESGICTADILLQS